MDPKARASLAAVAALADIFARGGYVRRADPERRETLGPRYKKGYEVRLVLESERELREVRRILTQLGFQPAKPFYKHDRIVQPVYGEAAVEWFLSQLERGRPLSASGFRRTGARCRRRPRDGKG